MYYEYWGLNKAPFDNVPDPTMYVSSHASAATAISETLFAVEEGNECLAVIVGDVGLGKTMSLRMIIDSMDQDRYRIAFIVNPDMSFVQLLKEIVGQLTGEQCEIRKKLDLLEAFNRLLFETVDQGKKVVIFIDEANAMSPSNLEKMRLLTNLQPDDLNLFTIVLAGQIEFAKRLAHPKRANLFQRVGTYCTLEKIESADMVRSYVDTRLSLAGGTESIFTDDAIELLWKYSEYGVPRLINKIAKLSVKAGETNGLRCIDGTVVSQIAERFQRLNIQPTSELRPTAPAAKEPEPRMIEEERVSSAITLPLQDDEESYVVPTEIVPEPAEMDASAPDPTSAEVLAASAVASEEMAENQPRTDEELPINQYGVNVNIPANVIDESHFFSDEQRMKLAGVLAAQTIQKHPRLTATWGVDPLAVWSEIREVILGRLRPNQDGAVR
jgi:type II secretory pathway predicted ATPase ExeA